MPADSRPQSIPQDDGCLPDDTEATDRAVVLSFVRTPLAVRCNIVKFWRRLPANMWALLDSPQEIERSRQCERRAVVAIAMMVAVLILGLSSFGYRAPMQNRRVDLTLIGTSPAVRSDAHLPTGWYFAPGQALSLILWVVLPPLVGWAFVRLAWMPLVTAGQPKSEATVALMRHLSGVYLYVYLMILVGATLLPLLMWIAPVSTQTFRWCLWCFLFGESFFVPAVMWLRLIVNDPCGRVFGKSRYVASAVYLAAFVVIPVIGMVAGM